jgi:hypothetical protein
MREILSAAGRVMLKTLASGLIVLAIGISAAPNLDGAVAFGIASIVGLIAALAGVAQGFVPQLSFKAYIAAPWGAMVDSFAVAAIGAFLTSVVGILAMPELSAWHSLIVAAIVGAFNAGFRAVQAVTTKGEKPAPEKGITTPARRA